VSSSSCLALDFHSLASLSASQISVFHHGFTFSEGLAFFAVFRVASMSAACSAIAAFLTSSCGGVMLVSCENMLLHFFYGAVECFGPFLQVCVFYVESVI
jgi:hypothetical protein